MVDGNNVDLDTFALYKELYSKEELHGFLVNNSKIFSDPLSAIPFGFENNIFHGFPSYEHEYNNIEKFKKSKHFQLTLKKGGFLDKESRPVIPVYEFNEYGFRSESWATGEEGIIFLGCSDTFGTSQFLEKTWPYLVAEHFGVKRYNLAKPGGSNDSAYRFLKNFIKDIPGKYVCMLEIELTRLEVWSKEGVMDINGGSLQSLYSNKELRYLSQWYLNHGSDPRQSIVNYTRSIDAIKYLCVENNKQYIGIYNPCYDNSISGINPTYNVKMNNAIDDLAGDCLHKGKHFQKLIADEMIKKLS